MPMKVPIPDGDSAKVVAGAAAAAERSSGAFMPFRGDGEVVIDSVCVCVCVCVWLRVWL